MNTSSSSSSSHAHSLSTRVRNAIARATPELRNAFDAVAFAIHCLFMQLDARPVALSDDKNATLMIDSLLPANWNASPDLYCFLYKLSQAPHHLVEVKLLVMGRAIHVHAARRNTTTMYTCEIGVDEFVSYKTDDGKPTTNVEIYTDLDGLIYLVNDRVASKLVPAAETWHMEQHKIETTDPLRMPNRPLHSGHFNGDLQPDFGPFGVLPGVGNDGGNIMGPNHPIFDGRRQSSPRARFGPRFDPFGPGPQIGRDPDPNGLAPPGRFTGRFGPSGNGGNNFFSHR